MRISFFPEFSGRARQGWCDFPKRAKWDMRGGWTTFEGHFDNLTGPIEGPVFPSGAGMGFAKFVQGPKMKCRLGGQIPFGNYWKSRLTTRMSYFPEISGRPREGWCKFPKWASWEMRGVWETT